MELLNEANIPNCLAIHLSDDKVYIFPLKHLQFPAKARLFRPVPGMGNTGRDFREFAQEPSSLCVCYHLFFVAWLISGNQVSH